MEKNYSETLNKAKTYFSNMIKEREKYMQRISLDLPKRIEIETLPLSSSNDNSESCEAVEKKNKSETKNSDSNGIQPLLKVDSFDFLNTNENTELKNKNQSSSKSIMDSLSISTTESPVSNSLKISTSSSTAQINQKCQEVIEKAKNYFETRKTSKLTKTPPLTKVVAKINESTCTKADQTNNKNETKAENTDKPITNTTEELANKKGKINSDQKKLSCFETPAKKYLRSKLGIDQKSINVKKENKESFRHTKTNVNRIMTKIKTFPNTTKESKRTTQKDTSRSESPQLVTQIVDQTPEHLTAAKRYLRSKLGYETSKKDNVKQVQDATANTEPKTGPQPEPSSKTGTRARSISPAKVRQPTSIRPVSRNRETNPKKLSAANETPKNEKSSKSIKDKRILTTKTAIVTNIEPGSRETNKLSIELKQSVLLTSSMEKLVSKALKIGLKKINRSDLQNLQLNIKSSVQIPNNISGLEPSIVSEKSDLASMQLLLESKISNFQTEMERRQKHTFDKIQALENTIQFRKQQLMENTRLKNKALKNYEKNKPQI